VKVEWLTELEVADIDDVNWQLIAPFQASIDGELLTVPAGFKTDFASVPRIGVIYAALGNKAHRAAVLHDWLYTVGGTESDRAYADNVLRAGCIADGMDHWPRSICGRVSERAGRVIGIGRRRRSRHHRPLLKQSSSVKAARISLPRAVYIAASPSAIAHSLCQSYFHLPSIFAALTR
jgi:hypothetical protein